MIVTNCTFTANVSLHPTEASAVLASWSGSIEIVNSILWGNTAAGEDDGVRRCGQSARAAFSTISDDSWRLKDVGGPWPGTGNLKADPLFRGPRGAGEAPTAEGDYRLLPGSPAIDRGQPDGPDRDLEGSFRPQGDGYDMGAYESSPAREERGVPPPLPEQPDRRKK